MNLVPGRLRAEEDARRGLSVCAYLRAGGRSAAAVLGMRALLRYPSQVGDVSERPKVQLSKSCVG